jgi:hypothetical protein
MKGTTMKNLSARWFLMSAPVATWAIVGFSCAESELYYDEEVGIAVSTQNLPKGQGGTNGDLDFCNNPASLCTAGEGDCDGDAQCDAGLICGLNIGDLYGFSSAWDICVASHCVDDVQNADETGVDCGGVDCAACDCGSLPANGQDGHCTPRCPCPSGEGDCDSDAACEASLVCGDNNGDQFGFSGAADFCVPASCTNGILDAGELTVDCGGACGLVCPVDCSNPLPNGNINRCTESCPCDAQFGDCDNDLQCVSGTSCFLDVGDEFGFSSSIDMCLATTCDNGVRDGDEAGVDCGPSCVPCEGNAVVVDSLGAVNLERASDVAIDSAGNTYIIGQFRTSTDVGGGSLSAAAGSSATADEIVVAKYDELGAHVWSSAFGGDASDGDRGLGIAVDGNGVVAITGSYRRSIDFGGGAISTASGADAFVAVFETDGTHRWSSGFGTSGVEDAGLDVVFDSAGLVVVTGFFSGTINFGGSNLTSNGAFDIFVARFQASNGAHVDSTSFGGPAKDEGVSVTVDSRRRVYVTGSIRNTVSFGSTTLTSAGGEDIFVALLSRTDLSARWAVNFGDTSPDFGRGIAVDANRYLTVAGSYSGSPTFGTTTSTAVGALDAVVLGLDGTDGSVRWVDTFGGTDDDEARGVAVAESTGDVYVVGYVNGTVSAFPGGGSTAGLGVADAFLAEYTSSGGVLDAFRDGGSGADRGLGVDESNGSVAYFGDYEGTADVLGTSISSAGSTDLFLTVVVP